MVKASRLRETLERLCRRFPGATVILDLSNKAAPMAAIQCLCRQPGDPSCRCQCKHDCDRPVVSVIFRPGANPVPENFTHAALDHLYGHASDDQTDDERTRYQRLRRQHGYRSPAKHPS